MTTRFGISFPEPTFRAFAWRVAWTSTVGGLIVGLVMGFVAWIVLAAL